MKHFSISYLEQKANDWVQSKINFHVGPQELLLATVKRRKFAWFGHVTSQDSLSKTILQGTLEGGRRHVRQRKCWIEHIKEWTSPPMPELFTRAFCRKDLKMISAESSIMFPRRPSQSRDWTELNWSVDCRLYKFHMSREVRALIERVFRQEARIEGWC